MTAKPLQALTTNGWEYVSGYGGGGKLLFTNHLVKAQAGKAAKDFFEKHFPQYEFRLETTAKKKGQGFHIEGNSECPDCGFSQPFNRSINTVRCMKCGKTYIRKTATKSKKKGNR